MCGVLGTAMEFQWLDVGDPFLGHRWMGRQVDNGKMSLLGLRELKLEEAKNSLRR